MNTLYMMIGLPGSGKSTIANKLANYLNIPVVSSDKVREELTGSEEDFSRDGEVWVNAIPARLNTNLLVGDVVFDATNLRVRDRNKLSKHLMTHEKVAIVVDTPMEECIARQATRSRKVPIEVIQEMQNDMALPAKEEHFKEVHIVRDWESLLEKIGKNMDEVLLD